MGVQDFVVIVLILAAVTYTVYSIIKVFVKKPDNSCGCSSCDIKGNTKDIRSLIQKNL
jgi:hypothetical protein